MLKKPKRIVDPIARRKYLEEHPYCEWCGKPSHTPHHIASVGAGGDDVPENLFAVCAICHARIHLGEITKKQVLEIKYAND